MDNDKGRFDQAVALLPLRWQRQVRQMPEEQRQAAEEIRLRSGQPLTVLLPGGEVQPGQEGEVVSSGDLEQMCDSLTGYSRYAVTDTLRHGYLTARGGFRIGVCGSAVMRQGVNTNLRDISSLIIRLSRERKGVAADLLPRLFPQGRVESTLILSPPGLGKTTLLRDLVRLLSDGAGELPPHRVSVVDERGEIAVMQQGQAQMDVGRHTDVMDGCPKAIAIPMLLRAANPQVIAVDEITVQEDLGAMVGAAHCGVALLATVHAASPEELGSKPLFRELLETGVFSQAVTISAAAGGRAYEVTAL